MYTVSKTFEFDAGHRLAKGYKGKCAAIHGHRYKVEVIFKSDKLDRYDMLLDFNIMSYIQNWIDENLDHKFLVYVNDPLLEMLKQFSSVEESVGEIYICNDNPTAEFIAKLISSIAKKKFDQVYKVVVWETPKCKAEYIPEG